MTFDKVNRRTHLYLGIALMPWFLLYAVSSVVLNHGSIVKKNAPPQWNKLFEREHRMAPFNDDTDPWDAGKQLLADLGMEGRYRVYFEDDNLVVLRNKFLSTIRLTYYPAQSKVTVEERRLRWNEALTSAHFRAGYYYPYFVERLWAFTIDLLVVSTLIWIASGLILWVQLKRFRFWGWVAIAAGMASFLIVVAGL